MCPGCAKSGHRYAVAFQTFAPSRVVTDCDNGAQGARQPFRDARRFLRGRSAAPGAFFDLMPSTRHSRASRHLPFDSAAPFCIHAVPKALARRQILARLFFDGKRGFLLHP